MKTILIACGTGMVSSAIMNTALAELLKRKGITAQVICCGYSQLEDYLARADLVIASMKLADTADKPVLLGLPFLTGVGIDALERDILHTLEAEPKQHSCA